MESREITYYLDRFVLNENRKQELDEKLLTITDKDEWVKAIKERAEEQRRMFVENNESFSAISSFIAEHPGCDFSKEQAEALYSGFYSIYYIKGNGMYSLTEFINQLLAYYHSVNDYSKVVILSLARFIVNVHHERLSVKIDKYHIGEDLFAAVGYKAYYKELSLEAKRKIFVSYNNLCTSALEKNIEVSYFYLQEFFLFSSSDMVSEEDRKDPVISSIINRVERVWFEVFKQFDLKDSSAVCYFKQRVTEMIAPHRELVDSYELDDYRLFRAFVVVRCMNKELTPEQGVVELCEYYKVRRKLNLSREKDADSIMFFIYIQQYIYDLIKYNNLDGNIIKPYALLFIGDILDNWGIIKKAFPPQYFDKFISRVFIKIIKYIDDDHMKEDILKKIVYQHHVSTSIHVNMVMKLSCLIAETILEEKPELFVGIWGYDLEKVISEKENILDYVGKASYFHDIGKIGMIEIINQQTRKIKDREFEVIKRHPSSGRTIAENTIILNKYSDVIEGHHKSYDGKSGYPESFDNTASLVRVVIDIVTIADCIDAATDTLGRNYQNGKTSETVLEEILAGGGTRYNPFIAEFIYSNERLRNRIRYLTGDGRVDELYSIYQEYSLL